MLIEFYPAGIRSTGYSLEDFLDILLKLGFKIFIIDHHKRDLLPVNKNIFGLMSSSPVNLLCLPADSNL